MGEWKRHGGGVVRSTNHPLLNFYNFCKYISFDVFSPSSFLTFWSSQLDFLQIADKFLNWPISINFHPLFQFYYLQCVILGWQKHFLLQWCKRVFFFSFFESRLNAVFDQIMWWLFFTRLGKFETILQPSKRFSSCEKFSPLGFCLLTNHSSCIDWITDKCIGAYFWFWITSSIASWFIFISL